ITAQDTHAPLPALKIGGHEHMRLDEHIERIGLRVDLPAMIGLAHQRFPLRTHRPGFHRAAIFLRDGLQGTAAIGGQPKAGEILRARLPGVLPSLDGYLMANAYAARFNYMISKSLWHTDPFLRCLTMLLRGQHVLNCTAMGLPGARGGGHREGL